MTQPRLLVLAAVTIIGLAGIAWQWQVYARLRREVIALRMETYHLADAQAENRRLMHALSAAEAEVVRLRTELASFRPEPASSAGGSPQPTPLASAPPIPTDTSTPRSVSSSVRLAIEGGDPDALLRAMTLMPDALALAGRAFERLSPELRAHYGTPERMVAELLCATTPPPASGDALAEDEELLGASIIDPALGEDAAYRTLRTVAANTDGALVERRDVYRKTDDGWRWLVPAGEVLRRLSDAGVAPPSAESMAVPDGT